MPQKQTNKTLHQREKMLVIARKLFATKGYEATTTRKINEGANTSDGLLYYYFPGGKKELLDAILSEARDKRTAAIHTFTFTPVTDLAGTQSEIMRFFKFVWATLIETENYQVFNITIQEKTLLTDEQTDWLHQLNLLILEQLTGFLNTQRPCLQTTADVIPIMAQNLVANLQATIFTNLVMLDRLHLPDEKWEELNQRISFILHKN